MILKAIVFLNTRYNRGFSFTSVVADIRIASSNSTDSWGTCASFFILRF